MKYNIEILISANADFFEICETLKEYGENPTAVFMDSFTKFLDNVTTMPLMFPQYSRKPIYRKAPLAYDYLVFYKVAKADKKNSTVKIYRILHGKQNIADLL